MCVIQKSVLTLFVCGMKKIFCQFFEHDDDHSTNYMKIIEHLKIHRFHWHFFWIYNFRSVCQHSHFGLISTHHYNFKKKYAFSETMNLLEATKSTTWAYFDNRMRHAIFLFEFVYLVVWLIVIVCVRAVLLLDYAEIMLKIEMIVLMYLILVEWGCKF